MAMFFEEIVNSLREGKHLRTEKLVLDDGSALLAEGDRLVIGKDGVHYRDSPNFEISPSGAELIDLPDQAYSPLRQTLTRLVKIVGNQGLARGTIFVPGPNGYSRWKEGAPMSLDSALSFYRFGTFSYENNRSAWGLNPNSNNRKITTVRFIPVHPKVAHGKLEVTYSGIDNPAEDLPSPREVARLEKFVISLG